jgi:AraC-like DNA-binding protein
MAQHGWDVAAVDPFRLSATRVSAGDFSVARIWHTPAHLVQTSNVSRAETVRMVVGMDSESEVRAPGAAHRFGPRQVLVAEGAAQVEIRTTAPTARLEMVTDKKAVGAGSLLQGSSLQVLDVQDNYWQALAAIISVVATSGVGQADAGFPALRAAVESAALAALAHSTGPTRPASRRRADLLSRAERLINLRYNDPDFGVAGLAAELNVSPAHLHRIFARRSATPYQAILERRTQLARHLFAVSPDRSAAAVARESGFNSVKSMRRALDRTRRVT